MNFLGRLATDPNIGFMAYPALLTRLYEVYFRFSGLSIAHFAAMACDDITISRDRDRRSRFPTRDHTLPP